MLKLTGCDSTKQVGTVTICAKPSSLSCPTGFHNMNVTEFKENEHTFFSNVDTGYKFPYSPNGFSPDHPNYANELSIPGIATTAYRIDLLNQIWQGQGYSSDMNSGIYRKTVALSNYVQ